MSAESEQSQQRPEPHLHLRLGSGKSRSPLREGRKQRVKSPFCMTTTKSSFDRYSW